MMPFENNVIAARHTPTPSLLQQQKGQVKQENTGPTCPGIPGKSCQEMIFLTGSSGQQLPLGSNFSWRVRFYHNKINNNHHLSLATSNPLPSAALQKHHAPFPVWMNYLHPITAVAVSLVFCPVPPSFLSTGRVWGPSGCCPASAIASTASPCWGQGMRPSVAVGAGA